MQTYECTRTQRGNL